ncbi:MAG: hypothetical protein A2341_03485 [Deltaproteobacteria bacterium RIFOXYB12_FULL_58_9]|nr:MAG: hypothetical protein A2341_03485 [Deltaproteobacteria bacterium RIFOXYB12_FULL_58_9]
MNMGWNASLATGINAIDSEHFDFLRRMNALLNNRDGCDSVASALHMLTFLEHHVLHHFVEEEEQMVLHDYPAMLVHRDEHVRLVDSVLNARCDLELHNNRLEVIILSNRLLASWLLEHLNTLDRSFAQFLRPAPFQSQWDCV